MATDTPRPAWARAALFQGLSDEELAAVAALLTPRRMAAGEALIRQGVWAGELFIIRAGVVEIGIEELDEESGAAREVPLRRLVGGDCFGEMSLISGEPPSATGRALTDGEVWALNQQAFLRLATTQPRLSRNINAILSERLRHTSRHKLGGQGEQVLVLVGASAPLARRVAAAVARFSRRPTLLVDYLAQPGDGAGAEGTLADLLDGRRRPAADCAAPTVVRGEPTGDDAGDLPSALGRLADHYQYQLVALPFGHPLLRPALLAYATRILVVGSARAVPALQDGLAGLPASAAARARVRLVLTDAPPALRPTMAALDALSAELGAPVRAIVPGGEAAGAAAIDGMARWLVNQRVGLVLGAGAVKGFAHVGALRALQRAGVPIDCVAGASIGALIGAAAARGWPADRVEEVLQAGTARVFRPTFPLRGLLSSHAIRNYLRREELCGERLIEHLPLPFAVSATDLTEGREVVIRRGLLWRAVLASAAIPGFYPPVRVGGHWLVDGGVVNPVPVSTAQLLGADVVIAVDLSDPLTAREELTAGADADEAAHPPLLAVNLMRSRDIMMSEIRARSVGEPGVLIKPAIEGVALRNFGEGGRFIASGEAAAEAALPALRERLPWLE
ncbi:MAG TPA: patatin-like phospholipase family protein [Thermomicrobiales bacterium]|nr:patatin-like phospholipase family protein [Thermomicrobiales bacterium]